MSSYLLPLASLFTAFAGFRIARALEGHLPRIKGVRNIDRRLSMFVRNHLSGDCRISMSVCSSQALPIDQSRLFARIDSVLGIENIDNRLLMGSFIMACLVGWLTLGSMVSGLALGGCTTICIRAYYTRKVSLVRRALLRQLPEALRLTSNALSAGASLTQALVHAVRESEPPISNELALVVNQIEVGVGFDDALGYLNDRLRLVELESITAALAIQRRSGGNLSELLCNFAELLKERFQLKGQLMADTAQARFSGKIVGLLPGIVLAFVFIIDPAYLTPLFRSPAGLILLGLALAAEVAGFVIVNRILTVDF